MLLLHAHSLELYIQWDSPFMSRSPRLVDPYLYVTNNGHLKLQTYPRKRITAKDWTKETSKTNYCCPNQFSTCICTRHNLVAKGTLLRPTIMYTACAKWLYTYLLASVLQIIIVYLILKAQMPIPSSFLSLFSHSSKPLWQEKTSKQEWGGSWFPIILTLCHTNILPKFGFYAHLHFNTLIVALLGEVSNVFCSFSPLYRKNIVLKSFYYAISWNATDADMGYHNKKHPNRKGVAVCGVFGQ